MRFRKHNVAQLEVMRPHFRDEAKLIAIAKQGRQQLEELFAQEREAARRRSARAAWSVPDGQDGTSAEPKHEDSVH